MIGVILTLVFILGESWINQLVVEEWRGRLVALYGSSYALSQLAGPILLGVLGTEHDYGFWVGVGLLVAAPFLLLGRGGAPGSEACSVTFGDLLTFCRGLPAIAWAVSLFAAFEAMILTLLPVYCLRQGFTTEIALAMVSTVVVGDALLQLPIGALADRVSRRTLFIGCAVVLLVSSLAIPLLIETLLIWPLWVLFGASAGGLFTLSLILIGERYRDDALVRANAHIAQRVGDRLPSRALDCRCRQPVDQRACVTVADGGGGVWVGDPGVAAGGVWRGAASLRSFKAGAPARRRCSARH